MRNGAEIIYRIGTRMMSAPVHVQPTFQIGKPIELFDHKFDRGLGVYHVSTSLTVAAKEPAPSLNPAYFVEGCV